MLLWRKLNQIGKPMQDFFIFLIQRVTEFAILNKFMLEKSALTKLLELNLKCFSTDMYAIFLFKG